MKNLARIAVVAAAAALALASGGVSAKSSYEKGEERLAKMLEGRVAGEPSNCITTMRGSSALQVVDGVALVYKAGDTLWVARPRERDMLRANDALIMDRFSSSRLCAIEPMRTIDRTGGYFTGVVFLEDFVPYTKAG